MQVKEKTGNFLKDLKDGNQYPFDTLFTMVLIPSFAQFLLLPQYCKLELLNRYQGRETEGKRSLFLRTEIAKFHFLTWWS